MGKVVGARTWLKETDMSEGRLELVKESRTDQGQSESELAQVGLTAGECRRSGEALARTSQQSICPATQLRAVLLIAGTRQVDPTRAGPDLQLAY